MNKILEKLPTYVDRIKSIKEIILTNIVLLGQTPCEPVRGDRPINYPRVDVFLKRLADGFADECAVDANGNPYAVIKGSVPSSSPLFVVAHMDTTYDGKSDLLYSVSHDAIIGPGLLDNSLGVGVLMSLPQVLKTLGLRFKSDIVLIGLMESLGDNNLRSIRDVLEAWKKPILGAVCLEGGERGRLNYFSNSMIRAEINCEIPKEIGWHNKNGVNAIVVINEVINRLLEIRLPKRPVTDIVLGRMTGGADPGKTPLSAQLAFELRSESDEMVEEVFEQVDDICGTVSHSAGANLELKRLSGVKAAKLAYHHPLVRRAMEVMEALDITPRFESSESELSVFLNHGIPAITLGIAHGEHYHKENEQADIESIFSGITQVIGIISAIDQGECDASK